MPSVPIPSVPIPSVSELTPAQLSLLTLTEAQTLTGTPATHERWAELASSGLSETALLPLARSQANLQDSGQMPLLTLITAARISRNSRKAGGGELTGLLRETLAANLVDVNDATVHGATTGYAPRSRTPGYLTSLGADLLTRLHRHWTEKPPHPDTASSWLSPLLWLLARLSEKDAVSAGDQKALLRGLSLLTPFLTLPHRRELTDALPWASAPIELLWEVVKAAGLKDDSLTLRRVLDIPGGSDVAAPDTARLQPLHWPIDRAVEWSRKRRDALFLNYLHLRSDGAKLTLTQAALLKSEAFLHSWTDQFTAEKEHLNVSELSVKELAFAVRHTPSPWLAAFLKQVREQAMNELIQAEPAAMLRLTLLNDTLYRDTFGQMKTGHRQVLYRKLKEEQDASECLGD